MKNEELKTSKAEEPAADPSTPLRAARDATDSYAREIIEAEQWEAYLWNGYEGQRCRICQWDTLDGPAAVEARVNGCPICRPPIVEQPIALILVTDRWGNEVGK